MQWQNLQQMFGDDFTFEPVTGSGTSQIARAQAKRNVMGIKQGQYVAAKSPRNANADEIERFNHEYAVLQKIGEHPQIIRCYGKLDYPRGHVPIILLEWAEFDLEGWRDVEYQGMFPDPIVDSIMEQVCLGLDKVHSIRSPEGEGYLHRDLKPSNILVVHQKVKLGDFGSAGLLKYNPRLGQGSCTTAGGHGTWAYSAPETISQRGKSVQFTKMSDIYSSGCVLYNLLFGNLPWQGNGIDSDEHIDLLIQCKNDMTFLETHLQEDSRGRDIPQHKLDTIRRSMDKDPLVRHQGIKEFLHHLQTGPAPDPARAHYTKLEGLLANDVPTAQGLTRIDTVDAMIRLYDKIPEGSRLKTAAFDAIKTRAQQNCSTLRTYLVSTRDKMNTGKAFKTHQEFTRFVDEHATYIMTWGHQFADFGNGDRLPLGENEQERKRRIEAFYAGQDASSADDVLRDAKLRADSLLRDAKRKADSLLLDADKIIRDAARGSHG